MANEEKAYIIEYADNPVNLRRFIDEFGFEAAEKACGYKVNTLRQMYDNRAQTRKFLEFGFENYYKAREAYNKTHDSLYIFALPDDSKELATLQAVANALGVTIQKL